LSSLPHEDMTSVAAAARIVSRARREGRSIKPPYREVRPATGRRLSVIDRT
jgi:hypothetical protein